MGMIYFVPYFPDSYVLSLFFFLFLYNHHEMDVKVTENLPAFTLSAVTILPFL